MRVFKPIEIVKSNPDSQTRAPGLITPIDPEDLIGRTFLTEKTDKGKRFRARIARKIINNNALEDSDYTNVKFLLSIDSRRADQIVGYNQVIDQLNAELRDEYDEDGEQIWTF